MYAGCRCPRCPDAILQAKTHEGCETLACRRCGGAFMSAGVGLRLLAILRPDVAPVDDDAPRAPCPVCRAPMRLVLATAASVDVDTCSKHGVWFDGGDLAPVLRAVAKALGKPVPAMVERLEQHAASAQPTEPASTASEPSPTPGWSPTVTQGRGVHRPMPGPSVGSPVVDAIDVVTDVLSSPLRLVALPFELTLATVELLTELAD